MRRIIFTRFAAVMIRFMRSGVGKTGMTGAGTKVGESISSSVATMKVPALPALGPS
jgi:hypothetical protein